MRRQQIGVTALTLALAALAAFLVRGDGYGLAKIILLAALQTTPFFVCVAHHRMDYLSVILGAQFIGYSLYPLLKFIFEPAGAAFTPYQLQSADMLIGCTLLIQLFYYGGRFVLRSRPHDHEQFKMIRFSRVRALVLGVLVAASFLVSAYVPGPLQQFFLSCQFLMTCLVFCIEVPEDRFIRRLLSVGVLVGAFYSFLVFANLGFAVNLLVIWLAQATLARSWRSFAKLGILFAYMVCLQGVKHPFRYEIARDPQMGAVRRTQVLLRLIERRWREDKTAFFFPKDSFVRSVDRIPTGLDVLHRNRLESLSQSLDRAHDESLEKVLEWTPARVPFWRGRSFFNFPYLLVPHLVWPGKPRWNLWNEFGHRYGYLSSDDTSTIVLFSYFAEGYMNFGRWGAYAMAIFVAIFFVLLEKISDFDVEGYYSFTFIAFLMTTLAYQTDVGSMLVRWLYAAVIILPLRTPLLAWFKQPPLRPTSS